MNYTTGHSVVDEIGKIHFEGNVIPHSWYHTLRLDNGKPDLIGMAILSDVVYWHRPTIVRDENSGLIKKVKKKFKADLLQRSYKNIQEQFGLTERQSRDALIRLEKKGVLKRVFRTIETDSGKLPNVMFIELDSDKLLELTFPESEQVLTNLQTPINIQGNRVLTNLQTRPSENVNTNTEITTEITYTEITTNNNHPPSAKEDVVEDEKIPFKKVIDYFNQALGAKRNYKAKTNRDLIRTRWNEGYRLEDFIQVIDNMKAAWTGTKWEQYLQPETLFGNKFDKYLNTKERVKESEITRGSDDIVKKYNLDVEREPQF